jgi:uncharacterized protein (UPF0264 family)
LAAADPSLWAAAVQGVRPDQKLSAALGECDEAIALASQVPPQFAYAKAGPAGIQSIDKLVRCWDELRQRLPVSVELVAVAYADHRAANSPDVESIFAAAMQFGIKTWLLDTFGKADGQGVVHRIEKDRFRALRLMADKAEASWVLAGSIRMADAISLVSQSIHPDLFGVRGDVCEDSRTGTLVAEKVMRWLEVVRSFSDNHHHGHNRGRSQSEANVR